MVLREHGGAPSSFPHSRPHWLYHQNLLDMSTCHNSVLVRRLLRCKRLLVLQLLAIHRETLPPHRPFPKGACDQFEYQEVTLEQTNSAFCFHVFSGVFLLLLMKKDGRRQTTDMGEGGGDSNMCLKGTTCSKPLMFFNISSHLCVMIVPIVAEEGPPPIKVFRTEEAS